MPDFDLRMALQIFGALLCIANYLLIQTRRITATQPVSLLIVASGGVILLASAILGADWGLIMLEVSWLVMVSVTLIVRHRESVASAAAANAGAEVDTGAIAVGTAAVETVAAFDMGNTGELELVGAGR
ncbi:hypothetical protein [Glycomyces arizonensis]|uniref:hypothetical protein n=1 Tax=Glycomyces arizonensis TaxID=256035 RepID=UPI0003F7D072|nr:hypothetical protein [Glycomyces arizonensis]